MFPRAGCLCKSLCSKVNISVSPILYPQFKKAQEIFELKRKESTMQAEIQGGRAAVRKLGLKQCKLDEEARKQQEILTHRYVSYSYGDLERWVIR